MCLSYDREEPDVQPWACSLTRKGHQEKATAPLIRNGTFQWQQRSGTTQTGAEAPFQLKDINIDFPSGLHLITGETASGKSSLLSALLGEMDCLEGEVMLNKSLGNVALCTQSAWLTCVSLIGSLKYLPDAGGTVVYQGKHLLRNSLGCRTLLICPGVSLVQYLISSD